MEFSKLILIKNECYLRGTKHTVKGVMYHSTGSNNPNLSRYLPDDGVTGYNKYGNHWNQFRPSGRQVCVHAFIGKDKNGVVRLYQTLPFDIQCWGSGRGSKGSANEMGYVQFEICEDALTDKAYLLECLRLANEFTAYLAKTYGFEVNSTNVIDHIEGNRMGIASGHSDISHWLKRFGMTMNDVRADVKKLLEVKPELPNTAPKVMFRVIIDGEQIMALSALETAIEEVNKRTPKGKIGLVQRNTDNVVMFTFNNKEEVKPILYRVIIDGSQIMALSGFADARAMVIEKTPVGKKGIVQRNTDGVDLYEFYNKPKETWELHIFGDEVEALQTSVNRYFGYKKLDVDGYYGDDTKNGVPNNIKHGIEGHSIVGEIQKRLIKLGFYKGKVDNSFGDMTRKAVMAFQKSRGFKTQDGIVGVNTFSELYKR